MPSKSILDEFFSPEACLYCGEGFAPEAGKNGPRFRYCPEHRHNTYRARVYYSRNHSRQADFLVRQNILDEALLRLTEVLLMFNHEKTGYGPGGLAKAVRETLERAEGLR